MVHGMLKAPHAPPGRKNRVAGVRRLFIMGAMQVPNTAFLDSRDFTRSEEHTSELQSQSNLVCRLLLEKTKTSNDQTRQCGHVLDRLRKRGWPARTPRKLPASALTRSSKTVSSDAVDTAVPVLVDTADR